MADLEVKAVGVVAQNPQARVAFAIFQIFNPINWILFGIYFGVLWFNYPSLPGEKSNTTDSKGTKVGFTLFWSFVFYAFTVFVVYLVFAKVFAGISQVL
jgi:hypothetical protein